MMRAEPKGGRRLFIKHFLNNQRVFALGQSCAITNAKDVRVHRESFCAKGCVHHDIGGFAAHAW